MELADGRVRNAPTLGPMGWLALSPLLALVAHLVCAFVLWPDGPAGLRRMAAQEAAQVSAALGERARYPAGLAAKVHQWVTSSSGGRDRAAAVDPAPTQDGFGDMDRQLQNRVEPILEALRIAVWLVTLRAGVLLVALPVFALAAAVGVADGLILRYLRRAGGARESSFLYHRAKHAGIAVTVVTCLLYLALPVALDPRLVMLPAAIMLGLSLRMAVGYFKKYL